MNIAATTRAILPPLVAACARNRGRVVLIALLLAIGSLYATVTRLGVTTDTSKMFADTLPWKQRADALGKLFPQNSDLIVAVVDATIPEEAEATAAALANRLQQDKVHFVSVRQPDQVRNPGKPPYLQQNAFLLLDQATLQDVLDRTTDAQPFLGELVADPSLRGLFGALDLVAQGAARGVDVAAMTPALQEFHTALAGAVAGSARPVSWQMLLGGKVADLAGRYRFVLARAKLDYGALEPGGTATVALRAIARDLPYVRSHDARVRLTGGVVLEDEEFATVAQGAVAGLIGSFLLVMLWLFLAVRSWRLMVPVAATLVLGLLLTTGFAALVIGTLNLISVAFAVLFVGIAVDFAIQFAVRFRERMHNHPHITDALRETGRRSGAQILVASMATASGFLAFTPTNFVGVAQLGWIAGFGMLVAFTCTITFLPAMLCLCGPRRPAEEAGFAFARHFDPSLRQARWPVTLVFLGLATAGGIMAPKIGFDGDPLHTKNQNSEAVRTLHDLMADPITNPYTLEALAPSLAEAQTIAAQYSKLKLTKEVLTLNSFLPEHQAEKLAAVKDVAALLLPTLTPPEHPVPVTPEALRQGAAHLAATIDALAPKIPNGTGLRAIGADARALAAAPDATLLAANDALTHFLPGQLALLRTALSTQGVTLADMPDALRADWLLPDGRARVQALPTASVRDGHAMRSWIKGAVKAVPITVGSAVWILRSADTITGAFKVAAWSALAAIAVILAIALRRALDVALVMTPLLVSGLLTALLLRLFGISLNFANIIALPLLLGVGVSFNIYFVMNWRAGSTRFLGSATARAVVFSALTTSTAFGSLALSQHPGTASMGDLLLISLGCTVTTTLLFVPALLALIPRPHVALGGIEPHDSVGGW